MSNEFAHGLNGTYTGTGVNLNATIVQTPSKAPSESQERPELWFVILMAVIFVALMAHIIHFLLFPLPTRRGSHDRLPSKKHFRP